MWYLLFNITCQQWYTFLFCFMFTYTCHCLIVHNSIFSAFYFMVTFLYCFCDYGYFKWLAELIKFFRFIIWFSGWLTTRLIDSWVIFHWLNSSLNTACVNRLIDWLILLIVRFFVVVLLLLIFGCRVNLIDHCSLFTSLLSFFSPLLLTVLVYSSLCCFPLFLVMIYF